MATAGGGAGESTVSQVDMGWHKQVCPYRRFMEVDRESLLQTDESVREELELKYRKEALAARAPEAKKRRRTLGKAKVAKTLTPDEETLVKEKVEKALEPNGAIGWYLNSQRAEFHQAKQNYFQQCNCVKKTGKKIDETVPKRQTEDGTGAVAGSVEPVVEEESAAE